MAKTKKSAAVIGLHLFEKKDGDYMHFGLVPVIVGRTPYELAELDKPGAVHDGIRNDRVRNVSCRYRWDMINGLNLDGLQIWSQGQNSEGRLYGFEVEYRDVYSVDRERAIQMAHTLNVIDKRMEKQRDTIGTPKTFGQYVGQVAKAIGATRLVFVPKETTARGWSWDDVDVSFRDFPRGAIDHIDYQVDQWAAKVRQKDTVNQ